MLAIVLAATPAATAPHRREPAEAALAARLEAIDQGLLVAITTGDRRRWAAVMAPGFLYVAENEQAIDGPTLLSLLVPPKPGDEGADVQPFRIIDYKLRLAGDTATVIHHDAEQGSHLGSRLTGVDVTTEVWQRIAGAWKLRLVHTTPVPTLPPAAVVPAASAADHVGRYRAGTELVTVTADRNGLTWHAEGRGPRPLLAEASDVWFEPGNPRIRYIFHRDASGKVTEVLRRNENRSIVYAKLP